MLGAPPIWRLNIVKRSQVKLNLKLISSDPNARFVARSLQSRSRAGLPGSCSPCVKVALSRCQGVKANRASAPLAAPCAVAPAQLLCAGRTRTQPLRLLAKLIKRAGDFAATAREGASLRAPHQEPRGVDTDPPSQEHFDRRLQASVDGARRHGCRRPFGLDNRTLRQPDQQPQSDKNAKKSHSSDLFQQDIEIQRGAAPEIRCVCLQKDLRGPSPFIVQQ
jgi:hypothetical protein